MTTESPGELGEVTEELIEEIRDCLSHFYDSAYLVQHPLLQRFQGLLGSSSATAVRELRRVFLRLVEDLRPQGGISLDDPAWRPFNVLHQRYVLGKELAALEIELALGRRQIQREQHKALEALAIALLERESLSDRAVGGNQTGDVLWRELSRAASEQRTFDLGEHLTRALSSVEPLAEQRGVKLRTHQPTVPLPVRGDPSLFRQLLVGAVSFALREVETQALTVRTHRQEKDVVCSLEGYVPSSGATELHEVDMPEALLALAKAQGAEIVQGIVGAEWRLRINLPSADRERVVVFVEDNPDLVSLFSWYASGQGYRLVGVSDSRTALERIADIMPDAVVLDLVMQNVDGWEVLRQLKEDSRLKEIPVAVCSVLEEPELATALGADAYLCKPVRPAQFLECLSRLLSP